jgi:hypothetical protein
MVVGAGGDMWARHEAACPLVHGSAFNGWDRELHKRWRRRDVHECIGFYSGLVSPWAVEKVELDTGVTALISRRLYV